MLSLQPKKVAVRKMPLIEYYDLPYRYNHTVVTVLAQTPKCLFVYWDISDKDRENLPKNSKPFLIVTNETLGYHFEVEVNDYANSWYVNIKDANCKYNVTLCMKTVGVAYHATRAA